MSRPTYWLAALAIIALAGCQQGKSGEATPKPAAPVTQETAQPAAPQAAAAKEITMPSGLKYQDLVVGSGALAEDGSQVEVHYTGWLTNGNKFDSSVDRGQPFSFRIGAGEVIRGWDQGVKGMRVGGKRKLTIPSDLAYGAQGAGGGLIPPNSTLIFDVELLGVK
jgi:FKBP-type peptidyl-prolyl cis-trans isomerase